MLSEEDKKDIQLMVNAGINIHILNEETEKWKERQNTVESETNAIKMLVIIVAFAFTLVMGFLIGKAM